MMRIAAWICLVCVLMPVNVQAQAPDAAPVVLRPGDLMSLTVWRRPELSGELVIAADGSIAHPLLRGVRVAGEPMEAVESRLRSYLSTLEADPQFVVQPLLRIAVGGEVRQPSLYSFGPSVTVAQAVALAGGPTDRGRLSAVRLRRDGVDREVDLTNPQDAGAQIQVRSGDEILVERRNSFFRDYVAPAASVTAAFGAILNLFLR